MAQFMISVFHEPGVHASGEVFDSPEAMQAAFERVEAFNNDLMASGQFVFACGLTEPEAATRVAIDGSQTEGPIGSGPYLGGYWVVEAEDPGAAHEIAARAAVACDSELEVRRLQG